MHAITVAPASASFTCVTGTTCSLTFTSTGTKAGSTRLSLSIGGAATTNVTCAASGAATVTDGSSSFSFTSLSFSDCTNDFLCANTALTAQSLSNWTIALSSSTPVATDSYSITSTQGGWTLAVSNCLFGTSGTVTTALQSPTCTTSRITTAASTVELTCTTISYTGSGKSPWGTLGTKLTWIVVLTYSSKLTVS